MKKTIFILVIILIFTGCTKEREHYLLEEERLTQEFWAVGFDTSIQKFEDRENGIICYTNRRGYSGGISCIKLNNN